MFGFMTCDTQEAIQCLSTCDCYLLSPNDSPTKLTYYDGNGGFGTEVGNSINVWDWLSRHFLANDVETYQNLTSLQRDQLGITLFIGSYFVDAEGFKYACAVDMDDHVASLIGFKPGEVLFKDYCIELTIGGVKTSINDHIEAGRLIEKKVETDIKLKISSKPGSYSNYPATELNPHQY
ncbi:hypothetical protein [Vibrio sp.]|uniref:hypothetical protein n=1 Tax=Vibrio sp. TaxID=678 RepID=UPI003D14BB72